MEQVAEVEGPKQTLEQLYPDHIAQLLANKLIQSGSLNMPLYPPTSHTSPLSLFGSNMEGNETQIALENLPLPTTSLPTGAAATPNPAFDNFSPYGLPPYINPALPPAAQLELINYSARKIEAELAFERYREQYTKILQNFVRPGGFEQVAASTSEEAQETTGYSTETKSDSEESVTLMLTDQQTERKGEMKSLDSIKRKTFPGILYDLLQELHENESADDSITWSHDGTGFVICGKEQFEKVLLQKHFRGIKFRSFQRQLNIYGFNRLEHHDSYSYKHKFFVRGQGHLINNIKRVPIKNKSP